MRYLSKAFIAVIGVGLLVGSAEAATCSASGTAPTVDGLDVANYAASTGLDKWFTDTSRHQGQTITLGSNGVLNSITYEIYDNQQAAPDYTWESRVSTISKPDPGDPSTWSLNVIHSEEATQDFYWYGADGGQSGEETPTPFMTWTFDSPVSLSAGTEYALDVGLVSTTSSWMNGIPYIKRTCEEYADGTRYHVPDLDGTAVNNAYCGDRVFHADIVEVIPEPSTAILALFGLLGLTLRGRRRRK